MRMLSETKTRPWTTSVVMPRYGQVPVGEPQTSGSAVGKDKHPEVLSCVTCRTRKLKCDRTKPVCGRCAKVKTECVYPESRRRPPVRRRNVLELEARLAQVEDMLKDVGKANPNVKPRTAHVPASSSSGTSASTTTEAAAHVHDNGRLEEPPSAVDVHDTWAGDFDFNPSFADDLLHNDAPPIRAARPQASVSTGDNLRGCDTDSSSGELFRLGQLETLPPFEMIEELHSHYFTRQQHVVPVIHKARYLQAFHSAPHMRPPMGLQYAIWAMAANSHEKYNPYHDVFLQRARQYMEADEVKGYGEHFLTVGHAQAWALIAADEARCMMFTRASMSSARCVRLVTMMGLHRLDDDQDPGEQTMAPVLSPPRDWIELEERRRALWGAFCIDSHSSISTGHPNLLDVDEITTHLPASEEAFRTGKAEEAPSIHEVFQAGNFLTSTFFGIVVACHLFNQILKHVHHPTPYDRPGDVDYGKFWTRHRKLDNTLSNAFMFLPERFRLPKNLQNRLAIHTNLNLHASVICLHNAACDKADRYKLPAHLKKASLDRLSTAAQEIVNIMRLTAHMHTCVKSPLVALSIYCAASVYIYQAKDANNTAPSPNLEFLMNCMATIGQDHFITRAFLHQAIQDIKLHGLAVSFSTEKWENLSKKASAGVDTATHSIPLLACSSISRGARLAPPVLRRPQQPSEDSAASCPASSNGLGGRGMLSGLSHILEEEKEEGAGMGAKRRRTAGHRPSPTTPIPPPPISVGFPLTSGAVDDLWSPKPPAPAPAAFHFANSASHMKIAHRNGPSSSSSPLGSMSTSATEASVQFNRQPVPLSLTDQQEPQQQQEFDDLLQTEQMWDMETGNLLPPENMGFTQFFLGNSLFAAVDEGPTDPWAFLAQSDGTGWFGGALNRGAGG